MRDQDRQRVYDAELAAFGGTTFDEPVPWSELVAVFETVIRHPWWQNLAVVAPSLVRGRRDSQRSSSNGAVVRIAPGAQSGSTLTHELAHHLVTHLGLADPGHGPQFRAAGLRTVELVGGSRSRQILSGEWARWGLSVGTWAFPEPPTGPGMSRPIVTPGPERIRGAIAL